MEGSFGKQLKTLRGRVKQLKQSDVAKHLNVSVASVNYWENDFNQPNMRNLKSLISLLFVEGAFTSAKEIEQFWQATDVPIDEVWLADLMKKGAPGPELPPMLEQAVPPILEKESEDPYMSIQTETSVEDDDSQVRVPAHVLPGSFPIDPAPPADALASQREQVPIEAQAITPPELPPVSTILHQNRLRLLQ